MSVEAIAIALNHSRARGAAKLVLLGIANHINPDNDGAWPSQAKLAHYANVSDRAVRDAVDTLVALGELRVEVGAGHSKSQYRPNRYWLTLSCPAECDGTTNHRIRVEENDTQGGSLRQSGWKPASYEPLREPEEEPYPQAALSDMFDSFWNIYPLKRDKNVARRALDKALKSTDLATIVEGARRYAQDPNRSDAYTKYPATWLNAGAWADGPLPERERTPDEKAALAAEANARKREIELAASAQLREQQRQAEEAAKLNPPKRCEHDRVAVMCRVCTKDVTS